MKLGKWGAPTLLQMAFQSCGSASVDSISLGVKIFKKEVCLD
jgi:hypothetical protein